MLPPELNIKELSLLPYPSKVFHDLYIEGSLFIAHVLKEGRVLYDDGYYANLRKIPFEISRASLSLQWQILKQRLRLFDNLSIYGDVFTDCLSHLYPLIKNVAIVALAIRGEQVFDKDRALQLFAQMFPEMKEDIAELCRLRPFSLIWSKAASIPEPFVPVNCRELTEAFLHKLRRIMAKVEVSELQAN